MRKTLIGLVLMCSVSTNAQIKMTLEQCLDSAARHNRTLQNAALAIEAADEQKKEAFSNYFPQISANVMAFHAFDYMIKGEGEVPLLVAAINNQLAPFAGQPYSVEELNKGYSATLSVIEPIYMGGRIKTGNDLAKLQQEAKKLQLKMKEKEVRQKVTENYWQIASVKYNLNTIEAAEKQVNAIYEKVNQFVQAGVINTNDLLKVKLRQKELASTRLKLENADHVLRLLLAQQIGLANNDIDIVVDSPTTTTPPDQVYTPTDQAVSNREELALAEIGVEVGEKQVKMERGKSLPSIAIGVVGYNLGLGGLSSTAKMFINTNMLNGVAIGTLSIPISNWWGGSHAIKRQKAALQESRNTLLDAQEQLAIDIEATWSDLQEAYNQIEIAESSVEAAKENLRLSTNQYQAGTTTITELLDAETLNRQSENNLSNAIASYQMQLSKYLIKVGATPTK